MGISGGVTKLETMISIFWTLANTSNRKKTVVILWRCSCSPPFASGTFGLVGSHKKSLKMFCAVQSLSNTSLKSLLVFPSPSFVASTSLGQTCFPIQTNQASQASMQEMLAEMTKNTEAPRGATTAKRRATELWVFTSPPIGLLWDLIGFNGTYYMLIWQPQLPMSPLPLTPEHMIHAVARLITLRVGPLARTAPFFRSSFGQFRL